MGRLGRNQSLAREVLGRLRGAGVRTFCLCPGGRNAPLVEALSDLAGPDVEVLDFFDERSASFFALGRARRDGRPAAVVTTSGTACAELLPAMVEAYYSCIPLIAVTADRPSSYRGTAAPQTIEQPGIFGLYARRAVDLERAGDDWAIAGLDGPTHINVCFDEPLLGGWVHQAAGDPFRDKRDACPTAEAGTGARRTAEAVTSAAPTRRAVAGAGLTVDAVARARPAALLPKHARPLVLLGALQDSADQESAVAFCREIGAPVLAEASSHVRARLGELLLRAGEAAARRGLAEGQFDSVVRMGDIPSWRLWRDLEITWRVPVVSVSRRPWPGLTHGTHVQVPAGQPLSSALPPVTPFPGQRARAIWAFDRAAAAVADCLLADFPRSEPSLVRRLSRAIPAGSFVYLGNSQPIREWNQFADTGDRQFLFGENRGANGIDGQLSTFLGSARDDRENWAVVGDLTALYDLQAAWALRHVKGRVRVVVLNNRGGRIFEQMFLNPLFQNRHEIGFQPFAALWGLDYRDELPAGEWRARSGVVELRPDEEETASFWRALRARLEG